MYVYNSFSLLFAALYKSNLWSSLECRNDIFRLKLDIVNSQVGILVTLVHTDSNQSSPSCPFVLCFLLSELSQGEQCQAEDDKVFTWPTSRIVQRSQLCWEWKALSCSVYLSQCYYMHYRIESSRMYDLLYLTSSQFQLALLSIRLHHWHNFLLSFLSFLSYFPPCCSSGVTDIHPPHNSSAYLTFLIRIVLLKKCSLLISHLSCLLEDLSPSFSLYKSAPPAMCSTLPVFNSLIYFSKHF